MPALGLDPRVHIEVIAQRDAKTVAACLERFVAAFPHKVHTILTDNGSEFTDRFAVDKKGKPPDKPSGDHPFDLVCARHGVKHKLTKPFHPQTNGIVPEARLRHDVERFNRRIAEVMRAKPDIAKNRGKNKFHSHEERNAFLHAFVHNYNRTRLRCLKYNAPISVLNNLTGHNTKAGMAFRFSDKMMRVKRL